VNKIIFVISVALTLPVLSASSQFLFNRPIFYNYSRLCQFPKLNFWELLWRYILQARCPSCHPTDSI